MIKRYIPKVRQFLTWWWLELRAMMPDKAYRLFHINRKKICIKLIADKAQFDVLENNELTRLGTFPTTNEGCAAYQAVLADKSDLKEVSKILALTSEQYLSRQITLPAQAVNNMSEVVGYEMDRFTPFRVDQVAYDVIAEPAGVDNDSFVATLIVVPNETLTELLATLNAFDVAPQKVCCSTSNNVIGDNQVNLLPKALRPTVSKKTQAIGMGLAALICVQLFVMLAMPIWQADKQVSILKQQISALGDEANAVSKMREDISNQKALVGQLIDKSNYKRPVIDIINAATTSVPDSTWLNQMRIAAGKLQISGFSTQATNIIQKLDNSPLFTNTRFTSPLATSKSAQQAFKITTDIVDVK